jgi:hypothetical protein
VTPNTARLGRFIFAGMHDYVRRVAELVAVGRVFRNGKAEDVWFVLCRQAEPAG